MKRNVIYNEGIRRLVNCSPEMEWNDKLCHITQLNLFMKRAGYQEHERMNMTKRIINEYSERLRKHDIEEVIMYKEDNTKKKKKKNPDWYKDKGYDVNIMIPATGNTDMKNELKTKLETISNKKILLSETYGRTTVISLKTKGSKEKCLRKHYKVCHHGEIEKYVRGQITVTASYVTDHHVTPP